MLKPESSICQYVEYKDLHFKEEVIGFHGYEQFFLDIFYRFWIQAKRKRGIENDFHFLKENISPDTIDYDFIVTKEGWSADKEGMFPS